MRVLDTALVSNSNKDYSRKKDIQAKTGQKPQRQSNNPGCVHGKIESRATASYGIRQQEHEESMELYRCPDAQERVPFCFPNERANPVFFISSLRAIKSSQPCR